MISLSGVAEVFHKLTDTRNLPDTFEALKAAFNEERMLRQEPVCDKMLDKKRGLLKSADI